jgi:hypothetical protein
MRLLKTYGLSALLLSAGILFSTSSEAYPDFISYGYKSCLTCHYNGQGSGPLNDYGRALFASEFTSDALTSKKPDQLADESGFLGSTELPWWIRPGFKYRGLLLRSDLGSPKALDRWINMQGDLDLVFNFDKKSELAFIFNYGYVPTPRRFVSSREPKPSNYLSKQHYLRWQMQRGLMLYAGLFDKIFGIRHADHTAYNRSTIGLGQSDQSHGIALQSSSEMYDISGGFFMGNLSQDRELRQVGGSLMGEYYLDKTYTIGASALQSESDFKKETRYAVHSRLGFAKGKSFILEVGLFENASKTSIVKSNKGYYTFLEGLVGLSKGYNFLTTYQIYKPDVETTDGILTNRLSLGFLIFPWQRTEMRFEVVNVRSVAAQNTSPDQWNLQSQVHISW